MLRLLFIIAISLMSPLTVAADAEKEFAQILQADNTAITQITSWIHNNLDRIQENETERNALALRIRDRLSPIRQLYTDFLKRYPDHARARVAYGSFLTHIDHRQGAIDQWKQALKTDPKNAAALNNLAIHLGTVALQSSQTRGIQEAFRALDKAIQLNPKEPLYRHNYATLLCSFRKPAARHYKIKPQQIIQKAIGEYDAAIKLSPKQFEYAADRAEAFLDLTPFPHAEAIHAWKAAFAIAGTPDERDWAHLQTAIAHYKGEKWKQVEDSLKRMTGEYHQALAGQLRRATEAKLEGPKP
ncbi:MAG: hypothetical protein ACJZ68_02535 [Limisphaerales bacterium]